MPDKFPRLQARGTLNQLFIHQQPNFRMHGLGQFQTKFTGQYIGNSTFSALTVYPNNSLIGALYPEGRSIGREPASGPDRWLLLFHEGPSLF